MEGKYFYPDGPFRKHAHVFFHFTDGSTLSEDVRKFGTMVS